MSFSASASDLVVLGFQVMRTAARAVAFAAHTSTDAFVIAPCEWVCRGRADGRSIWHNEDGRPTRGLGALLCTVGACALLTAPLLLPIAFAWALAFKCCLGPAFGAFGGDAAGDAIRSGAPAPLVDLPARPR